MDPSQPSNAPSVTALFPSATEVPFARFNNRYAGAACHVVGRGRTTFDYAALADVNGPVFFINDAVALEHHVRGESFFFAHDPQLLPWLDGRMRSTAVLPIDGKVFEPPPDRPLGHAGAVVLYRWRTRTHGEVLGMSRDELAASQQLFTLTGTIHSVLHFAWFCGFHRVTLIGCDGLTDPTRGGHDPRLPNLSRSTPGDYRPIVAAQRLLTQHLGFETVYLGTPT